MSREGYTIVPNGLLPAGELSARAFGIHVYLLSRPDGWVVRVGDLQKRFKEGRDAIYAALKELVEAGRLERSYVTVNGHPAKRYTMPRHPEFQDDGERDPEKPDTGNPDTGFQDVLVTTDRVVTTEGYPLQPSGGRPDASRPASTPASASQIDMVIDAYVLCNRIQPSADWERSIRSADTETVAEEITRLWREAHAEYRGFDGDGDIDHEAIRDSMLEDDSYRLLSDEGRRRLDERASTPVQADPWAAPETFGLELKGIDV